LRQLDRDGRNTQLSAELIALDINKQDPQHQTWRYSITRTPTIVVLKNGDEVGRIVEKPASTLAQDLRDIIVSAR